MDDLFERRLEKLLRADAERGVRSFDSRSIVSVAMREGATPRVAVPVIDFRYDTRVARLALATAAVAAVLIAALVVVPGLLRTGPPILPGNTPSASSSPSASFSPSSAASPSLPEPTPLPELTQSPSSTFGSPTLTTSPDATSDVAYRNWTPVTLPAPDDKTWRMSVTGVVSFQRGYVAVGSQQLAGDAARLLVWRSTDGTAWQSIPVSLAFSALDLWNVAADDTQIVVTGYAAAPSDARERYSALTSTDGETWTWHDAPDLFTTVTELSDRFVAATPNATDVTRPSSIWTSADGAEWTMVADLGALSGVKKRSNVYVRRVASVSVAGKPAVIAVGEAAGSAAMWIATDDAAADWQSIDLGPTATGVGLDDVASTRSGLLAIGMAAYCCRMRAWTSPNATDWTAVPDPLVYPAIPDRTVATANGFLVLGDRPSAQPFDTPAAWFTDDGATPWLDIPAAGFIPGDIQVQQFDAVVRPDGYVIVVATQTDSVGAAASLAWLVAP